MRPHLLPLLEVNWSVDGRTRVVPRAREGYRDAGGPGFADVGDPFNSLHIMTLPHNGWDGSVWGF